MNIFVSVGSFSLHGQAAVASARGQTQQPLALRLDARAFGGLAALPYPRMLNAAAPSAHNSQLGPTSDSDGNMYWGRSDVILSLIQYAEAEPTMFQSITKVILNYFLF